MEEGLTDWELNIIKYLPANKLRKLLSDDFAHHQAVGTLLFAIKDNDLMTYLLAHAWQFTHRLAMTCTRFWKITKSRAYLALLAKHALKDKIPNHILNQINFFHRMEDDMPLSAYLQGVFNNNFSAKDREVELYYLHNGKQKVFRIHWKKNTLPKYVLEHYHGSSMGRYRNAPQFCEFFNYKRSRKLSWVDAADHSSYFYCEVFNPERGETWYGAPGKSTGPLSEYPSPDDMFPKQHSWGVWK